MNANSRTKLLLRHLTCAAMCLALCLYLPFLTGQIPQIGRALSPMHIPVLLAGFLCGPWWAMVVGLVAPMLRHSLFLMPPLVTAIAMSFELAEQAWKNRLQSGVTPADCGSALPCAAAFTAAADYLGKRSRVESMTVGEVTVRGLSAASAKELAEALEQSAERLMEPYAVSGRFCFQGVRG